MIFINFRRSPRAFGARFFISLIHLWLFHDKWAKIRRTSKMCSSTKEIRGELRKSKNKLSESELYQLLTKIDVYEFMYSIITHIWSFKVFSNGKTMGGVLLAGDENFLIRK